MLCTGDRQADAGARQVFTRNSDTQMILGYVTAGERNQEPSPLELAVSVHKFQDPVELPPPGWNMVELGEVRVTTCLGHDSRNQKCHVCKNGSSVGSAGESWVEQVKIATEGLNIGDSCAWCTCYMFYAVWAHTCSKSE